MQLSLELVKQLVLFLLSLLRTFDEGRQEMIGEVVGGSSSVISVAGDVLKVDFGYLQDLGLMNLKLRDVEADGHVCVLYSQFSLSQRPRKEEEHEILVRVL